MFPLSSKPNYAAELTAIGQNRTEADWMAKRGQQRQISLNKAATSGNLGKFQAHRAGEGIMTGLLSSSEEEEVRFNSLSFIAPFIISSSSHLSHNDFENHMWSFFERSK
ncbi:hypothetical protein NQZ68_017194 [Dissostichus eleginoides]|nr:hypothetical protein NQZ68_017194 [Dissostichus eleginoides]